MWLFESLSVVTTTLKNYLAYLLKLNIYIPYDSAIPPLGLYPIERISTRMFIAILFIIAANWKLAN